MAISTGCVIKSKIFANPVLGTIRQFLTVKYILQPAKTTLNKKKRGQTRQPVLDREGRKCLQRRVEWRHASQVASTTESLHKMWCEIGKETLLDRIEPYCTELNKCVPC